MYRTLGNTIGAAYVGVVSSAILFGVANLQAFIFFRMYPRERLYLKIAVAMLLVLDALNLFLSAHAVYYYLVDNFGNFAALLDIVWSIKLQIVINVVIICSVQSLYAIRMWKFSELGAPYHRCISWFVWIGVACGFGIGVVLILETYAVSSFLVLEEIKWAIYTSFAASTAIDFMIAAGMCFYLQLGRSTAGYSHTNSMVSTLTQYVLGSGMATSACSMTALIAYAVMPYNLIFLSIQFLLTKLYVNSFLAMLNARQGLREMTESGRFVSNGLSLRTLRTPCPMKCSASVTDSDQDHQGVMTFSPREDDRQANVGADDGSISVYHWATDIPNTL